MNEIAPLEVQVINAKAQADYNMTPAGQMVQQFAITQRMGKMYANSSIVPDTYKTQVAKFNRSKNVWETVENPAAVGNCCIALDMAQRMNINPLMVMQNLFVVGGNPSFSTKFLVACINASKRFTPLRYEFKGEAGKDDYGCRCYAYEAGDKEHKEPLYGDWITWQMVNAEGWSKKQGSKWLTMPDQMFRYRAAAFWQRVYCPEISMGFITSEEAYDGYEDLTATDAAMPAAPKRPKTLLDAATMAATQAAPQEEEASMSVHDMAAAILAKHKQEKTAEGETVDTETGEILES